MEQSEQNKHFSAAQIGLIAEHLKTLAPDFNCPACKAETIVIYPHFAAIPIFRFPEKDITQEFYPAIMTGCAACGHVNQFIPTPRLMAAIESASRGEIA
jgi:transcription elongation factor Elf1